jgi:VWFA-related protein
VAARRLLILVCVSSLLHAAGATAQAPRRPDFATETSAVVLDVVVRDRLGRPVTGLAREDFQVSEGRARQTITTFEGPGARAVPATAPADGATARAAVTTPAAAPPRVVALAFEQLGPGARVIAAQAAHRLLDTLGSADFAGVFTLDRALHVVAPYAPPSPGLRDAIDRASQQPGMPLRRAGVVPGAEFGSGEAGQPTQETRDEAKRARGMATLDALTRLVQSVALLPGRKMVVLFSEGLALDASEEVTTLHRTDGPRTLDDDWLTDGRYERFQKLVEQANAAQVAFYTFDAAGLRPDGPFAKGGFGRAPYVGLLALAEGTGGAFVENTNDLAPGALRAAEDQASYYVLGYTPTKPADGEYRSLMVRARCQGCTVLARRGYRASPAGQARQVGVRDVAPLLALDREGAPGGFDVPVDVAPTAAEGKRRRATVTSTIRAAVLSPGGVVTFLVRVTDGRGRVAAVVSQHVELPAASQSDAGLRFTRALAVPDDRYVIEFVVFDHASGRAGIVRRDGPELRRQDPSQRR